MTSSDKPRRPVGRPAKKRPYLDAKTALREGFAAYRRDLVDALAAVHPDFEDEVPSPGQILGRDRVLLVRWDDLERAGADIQPLYGSGQCRITLGAASPLERDKAPALPPRCQSPSRMLDDPTIRAQLMNHPGRAQGDTFDVRAPDTFDSDDSEPFGFEGDDYPDEEPDDRPALRSYVTDGPSRNRQGWRFYCDGTEDDPMYPVECWLRGHGLIPKIGNAARGTGVQVLTNVLKPPRRSFPPTKQGLLAMIAWKRLERETRQFEKWKAQYLAEELTLEEFEALLNAHNRAKNPRTACNPANGRRHLIAAYADLERAGCRTQRLGPSTVRTLFPDGRTACSLHPSKFIVPCDGTHHDNGWVEDWLLENGIEYSAKLLIM